MLDAEGRAHCGRSASSPPPRGPGEAVGECVGVVSVEEPRERGEAVAWRGEEEEERFMERAAAASRAVWLLLRSGIVIAVEVVGGGQRKGKVLEFGERSRDWL